MSGLRKHERLAIFERDGYRCRYCGIRYIDRSTGQPVASKPYDGPRWASRQRTVGLLHVDHVIPRCKGGTNEPENLVTACVDCNLAKYDNVWEPRPLPVTA